MNYIEFIDNFDFKLFDDYNNSVKLNLPSDMDKYYTGLLNIIYNNGIEREVFEIYDDNSDLFKFNSI